MGKIPVSSFDGIRRNSLNVTKSDFKKIRGGEVKFSDRAYKDKVINVLLQTGYKIGTAKFKTMLADAFERAKEAGLFGLFDAGDRSEAEAKELDAEAVLREVRAEAADRFYNATGYEVKIAESKDDGRGKSLFYYGQTS